MPFQSEIIRAIGLAALALSAAAPAQITSYRANNAAPLKGDADKIVCQKEEKIGTRLGAKKVCLTVAEWNERASADRATTERIQGGVCVAGLGGEGPTCLGVKGP